MKPLKFHIEVKAQDCYLYGGHIFIITENGELIFCSFTKFVKKLIKYNELYASFLRLSFLRNDYLKNTQAEYFFSIPTLKESFDAAWEKLSGDNDIVLEIDEDDFEYICNIPELPVYDIKAYAMRLYIATKKGLYEIELKTDSDGYKLNPSKLNKVFDAKVIGVNAKSGEVFASAGTEGLFHGSFLNKKNILEIVEKPIQKKSLKTAWSSYNIVNYSELNKFNYLINETTKQPDKISYLPNYSKHDDRKEHVRINKVCTREIPMTDLLRNSAITSEEILYCFNSNENGFFYLSDGNFYLLNLIKDNSEKKNIHFSSRKKIIPFESSGSLRPLSSQIIPNGCVVEFYNGISLFHNNTHFQIEDDSALSFRSYINSIRYRHIISIVKEELITLHAIYPFEDNKNHLKDAETPVTDADY